MIEEKIKPLEQGLIRLEVTMESLANTVTKELTTLSGSVSMISSTLSKMDVTEARVSELEKDVKSITDNTRDDLYAIHTKISEINVNIPKMSDEHNKGCAISIERAVEKSRTYSQFIAAVLTAAFGVVTGYLYIMMHENTVREHIMEKEWSRHKVETAYLGRNMPLVREALETYRKERSISGGR